MVVFMYDDKKKNELFLPSVLSFLSQLFYAFFLLIVAEEIKDWHTSKSVADGSCSPTAKRCTLTPDDLQNLKLQAMCTTRWQMNTGNVKDNITKFFSRLWKYASSLTPFTLYSVDLVRSCVLNYINAPTTVTALLIRK